MLKNLFKSRRKNGHETGKSERLNARRPGQLRITFFGGKGGVGKTTCSAIFASALAEKGYRTLLISTDPAHSLGDLFGLQLESGKEVAPNLTLKEMDSEKAADRYIMEVKGNLEKLTAPELWKEVERQIDFAKSSPGADEAALFDELVKEILDAEDIYDHLVIDTAPTGHTLRLLTLPDLMEVWMEGMLAQRRKSQDMNRMLSNIAGVREEEPADQVYNLLQMRKHRFSLAKDILLDENRTSFYFVLNPERLPILETEKAIKVLRKNHISVGGIVVNRILPDDADGQFLEKRREQERIYLKKIDSTFEDMKKIYIPMLPADIKGLEEIQNMTLLFSDLLLMRN